MQEEQTPVALPTSWKTEPLPTQVEHLPCERTYTAEEVAVLSRGLIPQQMEDKWFVYFQHNALFFHRSWTGFFVYRVTLEKQGEDYRVQEAIVSRDPKQYKNADSSYDAALLGFLIDALLLGGNVPFPIPSEVKNEAHSGVYQHHLIGKAYPQVLHPQTDE